ncbi:MULTISPECIES: TadE/TadG family type IV pilus assembly protein [Clostridium]|uniref:TadE-like protein n=1 Tax=Clostridium ragsdalei P11 TaxID=1353534 RepID=A0A1A6AJR6_9CLOT|nr:MULTISPECIES: TadE family protein [Clostridium]OBR90315.1 TadE-like protein [Clostridium ragsdalei P11]QXE18121.1 pilus assembly protein TadG [Clostridium sp. 001]
MKTNQKEVVILKNLKNEKGQALVEFAIILPILLLIVMGIVQFGMVINSYLTIENASREGARAGIIGSTDQEIQYLIVATSPNLDPKNLTVTITPDESSRRSGDSLIVKVTYKYNLTVPIISSLFNNVIVLNGQTTMRVE